MTTLDAVNYILRRVGLVGITVLETGTNSVAGEVESLLGETSSEIQKMGWAFNRRTNVTATPDGSSHILIAGLPDTGVFNLTTDGIDASKNVIMESDRLYNTDTNTDVFTGAVKVRYGFVAAFTEVPPPIQDFITARTATVYNDAHGLPARTPTLRDNETRALIRARQFDQQSSKRNVLDSTDVLQVRGHRRDIEQYYGGW